MKEIFVKVISKDKADELSILGFKYVKETINGQTVYSFFASNDLMEYVTSKFSDKDFILTNKLNF